MSFLNAKDKEAMRDHLLAMRERGDQCLRILAEADEPESPRIIKTPSKSPREKPKDQDIPDGAWKGDQATPKQLAVLDKGNVEYWSGITKGEASTLIDKLFKGREAS